MNTQTGVYPLGHFDSHKYVVVFAFENGQVLLSRHRRRRWETQGGHIEKVETPDSAALRELYEESGVTACTLTAVCEYYARDKVSGASGVVFRADIHEREELPESEIAEVRLFATLPEDLSFPEIVRTLWDEVNRD